MSCRNFCGCSWRIIDTSKPKQVEPPLPDPPLPDPPLPDPPIIGESEFCDPNSDMHDRELCGLFREGFNDL